MPCLNEAETVATCVRKAIGFLAASGISGEVLIADNGSTDGSQRLAEEAGARVVPISEKGYGNALMGGIEAARGKYIVMGDADDSYDFTNLMPFIVELRKGADLVMGNRFKGGIAPGAMPPLHRYLGNPVLSFIGRVFFRSKIGDFHCGLRGFNRESVLALGLQTTGMDFASEMVVKATLAKQDIREVPTTLAKDGRSRPPHLHTWRDGWRHLRFLLLFAPRWLFFFPGLALLLGGMTLSLLLLPGPVHVTPNVSLDVHTLLVAAISTLIGVQCISFAVVVRRYAASRGLLPVSNVVERLLLPITLERVLFIALLVGVLGFGGIVWCVFKWADAGFGPLQYGQVIRVLAVSVTAVAISLQLVFTAFLSAIIEIKL